MKRTNESGRPRFDRRSFASLPIVPFSTINIVECFRLRSVNLYSFFSLLFFSLGGKCESATEEFGYFCISKIRGLCNSGEFENGLRLGHSNTWELNLESFDLELSESDSWNLRGLKVSQF